jgi:hypothetical protein
MVGYTDSPSKEGPGGAASKRDEKYFVKIHLYLWKFSQKYGIMNGKL